MDNNLKDKLDQSFETNESDSIKKEKRKKAGKIIFIVALILIVLIGIIAIIFKDDSVGKIIDKDENSQRVEEQVKIQEETQVRTGIVATDPANKPKELKEDYKLTLKESIEDSSGNASEDASTVTPDVYDVNEYKYVADNVTEARRKYYDENVGLTNNVKGYLPSEEDGYTTNKEEMMNGELLNEMYTDSTAEDVSDFISHEIEKRINPSYVGEGSEVAEVTSIDIYESQYIPENGEADIYLPEYTISFTVGYPENQEPGPTEGRFVFAINERGEKIWIEQ